MTDQERINRSRDLWIENRKGLISDDDLRVRLAYFSLESIGFYRFMLPPTPPEAVQMYRTKSRDERDKATRDGFWREPEHAHWLQQETHIWALNRANLSTLLELKKVIKPEDQLPIKKILSGYRDFIRRENDRAKLLGSEEARMKETQPQDPIQDLTDEALGVAGIFGGEVI